MEDMKWLKDAEHRLSVLENLGLRARAQDGSLLIEYPPKDQLIADGRKAIAAVRLVGKLVGYSDHTTTCAVGENARRLMALVSEPQDKMLRCNCGLDELLARLRSGEFGEE